MPEVQVCQAQMVLTYWIAGYSWARNQLHFDRRTDPSKENNNLTDQHNIKVHIIFVLNFSQYITFTFSRSLVD